MGPVNLPLRWGLPLLTMNMSDKYRPVFRVIYEVGRPSHGLHIFNDKGEAKKFRDSLPAMRFAEVQQGVLDRDNRMHWSHA